MFGGTAYHSGSTKTHLLLTYISNKAESCSLVASLSMYSGYIREDNLPPLWIMIFQRSQWHGDTRRDSSLIQQNQSHSVSIRQPGAGRRPLILEGCARDAVLLCV